MKNRIKKSCWNSRQQLKKTCSECGCCSKDKKTRYVSRLDALKEYVEEDILDIGILVGANKERLKHMLSLELKQLTYYTNRVKELENEKLCEMYEEKGCIK